MDDQRQKNNGEKFTIENVILCLSEVIREEHLASLQINGWILLLRSEFDCFIEGEPHQAFSFLFNVESGRFLSRVWGKTLDQGKVATIPSLIAKVRDTFNDRRMPCLGLKSFSEEGDSNSLAMPTIFPFAREISKQCQFTVKADRLADHANFICEPCKVVKDIDEDEDYKDNFDSQDYIEDGSSEENLATSEVEVEEGEEELPEGEECNIEQDQVDEAFNPQYKNGEDTELKLEGTNFEDENNFAIPKSTPEQIFAAKIAALKFSCKFCLKVFRTKSTITSHRRRVHFYVEKGIPCEHCDSKLPTLFHLLDHMAQKHPEANTMPCPACKERLPADNPNLQCVKHYSTCQKEQKKLAYQKMKETAEAHIPCGIDGCDKLFSWQWQKNLHIKAVHENLKYVCDVCAYSTHIEAQLRKHKLTHDR